MHVTRRNDKTAPRTRGFSLYRAERRTMSIAYAEAVDVPAETTPVTRVEIADHLETAFDAGPVGREELVAAAVASTARTAVVEVLAGLPERPYSQLRQLWEDLSEVPIGL
jgi:hypothetical protein